jgi:poly-beta-1,6-N-acetyl-D-glucosamine biosynthesis protein PgaD
MTSPTKPWPPLIVAERVPRLVKWRDALLTLTMWGAFAVVVRIELAPLPSVLQALGLGDFGVRRDWPLYFEKLTPFLLVAIFLVGLLVLFGLRTAWRLSHSLPLPQPAPLGIVDQARRAGLDEAALLAARENRIVVVYMNERGFRIEPKGTAIPGEGERERSRSDGTGRR